MKVIRSTRVEGDGREVRNLNFGVRHPEGWWRGAAVKDAAPEWNPHARKLEWEGGN
jgi:hypothetical protein